MFFGVSLSDLGEGDEGEDCSIVGQAGKAQEPERERKILFSTPVINPIVFSLITIQEVIS